MSTHETTNLPTLAARYPDGTAARRGDGLVVAGSSETVDFLSPKSAASGTVLVRGTEVLEIAAARVGLVVEEVSA